MNFILRTDISRPDHLAPVDVSDELNRATFQIKRSVDPILDWYAQTDPDTGIQRAAKLALDLVSHWRAKPKKVLALDIKQTSLFDLLEEV
ncbi:MAG: hypothetical protein NTX88_09320 [Candidatus Atribacteria bacterium]|nr:hypothetical protein [Candidatus Atribacteria bacterium]